ncbi:hypothetical protein KUL25_07410 [Rhodobacteraceae bacterium N5(2021)]|uniref:Uncharacterized protein n=1 Tax=Gymnodinialimonas phycosphaerae TaxID=2841589 RepID=A0A975TX58_9RHOB|nr:hypothetical protein [Gymnodinialimonas phycosphaerae]MBY4892590.1 hypothetical protein [Gymnodinialimonas phycosphaerae]
MRLDLTSAVALAATLSLSPAWASPLNWPEEGEALAFHCAAVLQAYGHAYEVAADLSGQPSLPMSALPAPLVQLAGGNARLADIAVQAEAYHGHAESVARTSFYPTLMGDGTPYLADDGRELMVAVQTCVAQFGL